MDSKNDSFGPIKNLVCKIGNFNNRITSLLFNREISKDDYKVGKMTIWIPGFIAGTFFLLGRGQFDIKASSRAASLLGYRFQRNGQGDHKIWKRHPFSLTIWDNMSARDFCMNLFLGSQNKIAISEEEAKNLLRSGIIPERLYDILDLKRRKKPNKRKKSGNIKDYYY